MNKWALCLLILFLCGSVSRVNAVLFPVDMYFYGDETQGYVTFSEPFTASSLTCDGYVRFIDFTWGVANFGLIDFKVDADASLLVNQVSLTTIGGSLTLIGTSANVTIHLPGKTVYNVTGASAYSFVDEYLKLKFTSSSPTLLIQLDPTITGDIVVIMPGVGLQSVGLLQVASAATASNIVVTGDLITLNTFTFGSVTYNNLALGSTAGENITITDLQPNELTLSSSASSASEEILVQVVGKMVSYVLGASTYSKTVPAVLIPYSGASSVKVLFSGAQGGFTYLLIIVGAIILGWVVVNRRR